MYFPRTWHGLITRSAVCNSTVEVYGNRHCGGIYKRWRWGWFRCWWLGWYKLTCWWKDRLLINHFNHKGHVLKGRRQVDCSGNRATFTIWRDTKKKPKKNNTFFGFTLFTCSKHTFQHIKSSLNLKNIKLHFSNTLWTYTKDEMR